MPYTLHSKPVDKNICECTRVYSFLSLPLYPISTPSSTLPYIKACGPFHLCTKRFLCKADHLSVIVWGPNSGKTPCH